MVVIPFEEINGLDDGIKPIVKLLMDNNIATFESCEGGSEHVFESPTIRFHGNQAEGYKAFGLAMFHGYRVAALRRYWTVIDGELTGPEWEITLESKCANNRMNRS